MEDSGPAGYKDEGLIALAAQQMHAFDGLYVMLLLSVGLVIMGTRSSRHTSLLSSAQSLHSLQIVSKVVNTF